MAYNLDSYVTVAERLTQAADAIQIVAADQPTFLTDAMGYIRVTVSLKDGRSATGTATFRLDLQGKSAQATNPIEDCETSAIGRALGFLGYGSSKSVASREEVQEAQRRAEHRPAQNGAAYTGVVPTCPEHKKPMKIGKDGESFYCPVKHGEKWYTVKAATEPAGVISDTAQIP